MIDVLLNNFRIMKTSGLSRAGSRTRGGTSSQFPRCSHRIGHFYISLEPRRSGVGDEIGVRLFNRTTRSVSLSEAGAQFVESIGPAIAAIRGAMEEQEACAIRLPARYESTHLSVPQSR
jgi:hypothetical protein